MPKGSKGCFFCGERSTRTLQVIIYVYGEMAISQGKTKSRYRKAHVLDSRTRNVCTRCLKRYSEIITTIIGKRLKKNAPRGCARCGWIKTSTTHQLKLWPRLIDGTCLPTVTSSMCEACADDAWEEILTFMGPVNRSPFNKGSDFGRARADTERGRIASS